jgi:hypothetical protein
MVLAAQFLKEGVAEPKNRGMEEMTVRNKKAKSSMLQEGSDVGVISRMLQGVAASRAWTGQQEEERKEEGTSTKGSQRPRLHVPGLSCCVRDRAGPLVTVLLKSHRPRGTHCTWYARLCIYHFLSSVDAIISCFKDGETQRG